MVRASKTTTTSTVSPVVETVVEQPKLKKAKTVKEVPAVAEPVVALDNAVVAPVAAVEVSDVSAKLAEYGAKVAQLVSFISVLKNDYKTLEKAVSRELKNAQKASSKKKRTSGNRQPSGFIKPTRISDELALFLGKDKGTELARTAVSKEINAYIRANSLQDPANGRKINPDPKLAKLLKIVKGDELTYFNLQRYMKHHFIKPEPVVAPAPVV